MHFSLLTCISLWMSSDKTYLKIKLVQNIKTYLVINLQIKFEYFNSPNFFSFPFFYLSKKIHICSSWRKIKLDVDMGILSISINLNCQIHFCISHLSFLSLNHVLVTEFLYQSLCYVNKTNSYNFVLIYIFRKYFLCCVRGQDTGLD